MKELKEQIIQAVRDSTDTVDGTVSIPIFAHFLDEILSEHLRQISGVIDFLKDEKKIKLCQN
jgi:hypothetical protein